MNATRAGRILVTDDDAAIRTVVREALRRAGHVVEVAGSLAEQRRAFAHFRPDVLVTDVVLPDGNGLDAVADLRAHQPGFPVIVLSAQNTFTTALRANEEGAFDYLPKPFDLGELARTVADALRAAAPGDDPAQQEPGEELPLIGRSPVMQEVYRTIARVVSNDLTVLILGESGTGKELVARAIHDFGGRKEAPFVPVNMAAIPRELIESELFGHERGAFTGAAQRNVGRFEQAQRGTLFLDEIGDMPIEAQTRLLRVLQSGEFTPVGSARAIRADVRIISATHQDLPRLIAEGSFREDLYYRLNVVPVRLPPLRERGGDMALLARYFLDRAAASGLPRKSLDEAAALRLERHNWPGNVRELENLMRRLAALSRDPVIGAALVEQQLAAGLAGVALTPETSSLSEAIEHHIARHLASYGGSLPPDGLYERILSEVERPLFRLALAAVRGNQLKAAKLLGLNRNTLRKKLTDLGVGPAVRRPD
ncbi:nitrogen regulation protein NR(I) [Sphingomonas sp.]|uniref:nitrogen regulation protein NR(I) n=1 Tax=Sphingomonas sp. TaxID=28214 RepID=UPI000DB29D68|nr:nitrogen regulation protein NR(I) [Sphingomonas sp.]PZU08804.1 MAG: nitrogen regulation protein NR(I) [Sphingomonas sp.]